MREFIRVVMTDGNRTVNWEFPGDTALIDALNRFSFEWMKDSATVSRIQITDTGLHSKIENFVFAAKSVGQYDGYLKVEVKPVKKTLRRKNKNKIREVEVSEDVR